jgi:hypothetical protein
MSRKRGDGSTFRQRDLREAIKAARRAGLENFRVEVDKAGVISVVPMKPGEMTPTKEGVNEWDADL